MKKTLFFFLLSLAGISSGAQAIWNNTSFVHRSNKQILDGQNNPVMLNGVNLGGWLLWEGWIWGGGYTQQKTIYNTIKNELGTPAADAFTDSVNANFITREDIRKISEQCYNVVRIPFNSSLLEDDFTPYNYHPEGWAVLDSVLSWCETYNVYAILDMHSAPGGQSYSFTADPDPFIILWNGNINQQRTKRMWKAIADRYKNRGIIAAYDLLNEPNTADSNLVQMYNDIIDSIRTVDTNHMISIEGNSYATDFSMFTSLYDQNLSFQFHMYTWFFPNTIASHLNAFTTFSNNINAPIWCGEWGENNYPQLDTTLALFNDPAYGVSGSAFWTWKKMRVGSAYPYLNGIDTTAEWNKTISWISNNSNPQPTVAEMQTGIADFIHNMKLANCTFNDTLAAILENCSPASVSAISSSTAVSIYPNPATDQLTLHFDKTVLSANVVIHDVYGKVIYTQHFSNAANVPIDISTFPKGLYFISVTDNNGGRYTEKLICE